MKIGIECPSRSLKSLTKFGAEFSKRSGVIGDFVFPPIPSPPRFYFRSSYFENYRTYGAQIGIIRRRIKNVVRIDREIRTLGTIRIWNPEKRILELFSSVTRLFTVLSG